MTIQRLRGIAIILLFMLSIIGLNINAEEVVLSTPQLVLDTGLSGEYDSFFVSDPCVIKVDGKYRMYYTAYGDDEKARIGIAESQDGVNFIKIGMVLDAGILADLGLIDLMEPCVLYEKDRKTGKGIYRMWYSGNTHEDNFIFYAESEDGINWTQRILPVYGCVNGEKMVREPSVIKEENSYLMWYSDGENVNLLKSRNGIDWHYIGNFVRAGDKRKGRSPISGTFFEEVCPDTFARGIFSFKVFLKNNTKLFLCSGRNEEHKMEIHIGELSKDNRIIKISEEAIIEKDDDLYKYGVGGANGMYENGKIKIWYSGSNSDHPSEGEFLRIFYVEGE